jgi:hypothetical protein
MNRLNRKLIVGALVGVLSLFGVTSAFAWVGVADTKDQAISLPTGQIFNYNLSASGDVDWYSWTNNEGSGVSFSINVSSSSSALNFDLYAEYTIPGSGGVTIPLYATDQGAGATDSIGFSIPAGATIYWKVSGHGASDYSITNYYQTFLALT